jgi:hypothetical protein
LADITLGENAMIKVTLKKLSGKTWIRVPVEELMDRSITEVINSSPEPMIAEVAKDNKKIYVGNDEETLSLLSDKGLTIMSSDMMTLLGKQPPVDILVKTFEGADFVFMRKLDPMRDVSQ